MNKVKEYKQRVEKVLVSKTGWGKDQLKDLLDEIYIEMLEELVEED